MISTRHAQANNLSFPDTYDASLPKQNLIYLDANNLYGWAMSQPLYIYIYELMMIYMTYRQNQISNTHINYDKLYFESFRV